jgi:hypothetical protein
VNVSKRFRPKLVAGELKRECRVPSPGRQYIAALHVATYDRNSLLAPLLSWPGSDFLPRGMLAVKKEQEFDTIVVQILSIN